MNYLFFKDVSVVSAENKCHNVCETGELNINFPVYQQISNSTCTRLRNISVEIRAILRKNSNIAGLSQGTIVHLGKI